MYFVFYKLFMSSDCVPIYVQIIKNLYLGYKIAIRHQLIGNQYSPTFTHRPATTRLQPQAPILQNNSWPSVVANPQWFPRTD